MLHGLKPEITTRPSGTRTRSTSRSTLCGSAVHSKAWGSTSRSTLCDSNGSASGWASTTRDCQASACSGAGASVPTQPEGHAVRPQQVPVGQPHLPGVIAEHVRHGRVELRALPGQDILPRRRLEPFGQFYNRRSLFCHVRYPSNPMPAQTAPAGGRELLPRSCRYPPSPTTIYGPSCAATRPPWSTPAKPARCCASWSSGPDAARHSTHAPSWRPRRRRDGIVPQRGPDRIWPRPRTPAALRRSADRGRPVTLPELDLDLRVLDVPGHTAGHIAYTDGLRE